MSKKVILCVDDEKTVLDSLKEQLRSYFGQQYFIELAENADDAWEIIEELAGAGTEILVIVSDWLMPGMLGDEFLIKVYREFPTITAILLTGQADADAVERAKNDAKLHRYLSKPWQASELVEAINSALG
jgi:CheY-like chemotaxis protein